MFGELKVCTCPIKHSILFCKNNFTKGDAFYLILEDEKTYFINIIHSSRNHIKFNFIDAKEGLYKNILFYDKEEGLKRLYNKIVDLKLLE